MLRKSLQQPDHLRRRGAALFPWLREHQSSSTSTTSSRTLREDRDICRIYNPPSHPIEDSRLVENIRSCIRGHNKDDFVSYNKDSGMSICFLGTSAGHPTCDRSTSATLLRLGGRSFLFDAGEGVQRQLGFTRARQTQIERVFITHLHGDHIFGLPGFLSSLEHSFKEELGGTTQETEPLNENVLKIYGPPGIFNFIAASITLSCTSFRRLKIEVYELIGGRVKRARGTDGLPNPFEAHYDELSQSCLSRKFVRCKDGVWDIEDFSTFSRHEILSLARGTSHRLRIRAAEVNHVPGVVTFGYVVEEEEPPRNIDKVKAMELGVPPGKKFDLLKYGYAVRTEDGAREVRPEQVLLPKKRQARKIAIIGDNGGWTRQMENIASNADVLVHEATLLEAKHAVSNGRSSFHYECSTC
jgi:ribonuclease Z